MPQPRRRFMRSLVSASLYGSAEGDSFNDIIAIMGEPENITSVGTRAVQTIVVLHGDAIDGLEITYDPSNAMGAASGGKVAHGTSPVSTLSILPTSTPAADRTNAASETITGVSGTAGESKYGRRVISLSFTVYDADADREFILGPYGGKGGEPFAVMVKDGFLCLCGYAVDTNESPPMVRSLFVNTVVPVQFFGDAANDSFDDIKAVMGEAGLSFAGSRAVKQFTVIYSAAVDGIQINYAPSNVQGTKEVVAHGTTINCTDPNVQMFSYTLKASESITAIEGTAGDSIYGRRIISLSFTVYDSNSDSTKVLGPYGGTDGDPFKFEVTGGFISLAGFAVDTDSSLNQLNKQHKIGGLYGLAFDAANFKIVQ
ncbi:hypothetical protein MKEN_01324900 [Mycena kentingensis (nom. inval.)]|nr:hypothetical protein MKEN_01324900 [Mycena kentingensis (nom. inval.)]